jgi:hypothetical protein
VQFLREPQHGGYHSDPVRVFARARAVPNQPPGVRIRNWFPRTVQRQSLLPLVCVDRTSRVQSKATLRFPVFRSDFCTPQQTTIAVLDPLSDVTGYTRNGYLASNTPTKSLSAFVPRPEVRDCTVSVCFCSLLRARVRSLLRCFSHRFERKMRKLKNSIAVICANVGGRLSRAFANRREQWIGD